MVPLLQSAVLRFDSNSGNAHLCLGAGRECGNAHVHPPNCATQTRTPPGSGCTGGYMIVRGFEVGAGSGLEDGFPLASGFVVPAGARLELQVRVSIVNTHP
jgi:hypothetical protein